MEHLRFAPAFFGQCSDIKMHARKSSRFRITHKHRGRQILCPGDVQIVRGWQQIPNTKCKMHMPEHNSLVLTACTTKTDKGVFVCFECGGVHRKKEDLLLKT